MTNKATDAAAKALYEHHIAQDIANDYVPWYKLPGKGIWRDRARIAVAAWMREAAPKP